MHRLFVALRPPPPIRALLAATQDGVAGARWQDDEQLHLTLRFIGAIERRQAEDLAATLADLHAAAPTIRLEGVGRFDAARASASLWAGLAPREPLAVLHRKFDRACVLVGLPPERRAYLPHVTLARLGRGIAGGVEAERWLARHAGLSSPPFAPSHLMLYESHLGRDGAAYEPVGRWPLDTDRLQEIAG